MMELKNEIIEKAFAIGFSKIGFTKVERLEKEYTQLQDWLSRGFNGTMGWMEKNLEKRIDPTKILPGAKSIISVAINYYSDIHHSTDRHVGKISRYAWGNDYHDVLENSLQRLLDYIKQREPLTDGKIYVDTGPVMEKVWAAHAGIGWQGKHTITITKEYGSWIFLGEIICNLEFDYDSPSTDMCGDCRLCIDACPTQAIVEPYVLDATRCISYLTIEHRGEVKNDIGERIDNWIFGCDICQDICPWNRKYSRQSGISGFNPRDYNISPNLRSLLEITQDQFNRKFENSPIKRRKLAGLKQSVITVLKNSQ